MAPKLFDQTVPGATYSYHIGPGGISIGVTGFPSLLPSLIASVLHESGAGIQSTTQAQFDRVLKEFEKSLKSYSEMPVKYAIEDRNMLLSIGQHSKEETLAALPTVDLDAVAAAPRETLLGSPFQLTAMVMGNMDAEDGSRAVTSLRDGLISTTTIGTGEGEVLTVAPVVNPASPIEVRKRNPRAGDPNDVVVVSLLAGVSTVESRVIHGLLGQMLGQLAYNELRTEQQLGYVVSAGDLTLSNVQAISAVVQGNALDADGMEAAVEHVYFESMPSRLANLSDDAFVAYRTAFKQQLLEPPSNIGMEFDHFWGPVKMNGECLELRSEMLRYLEESLTSKQPLVDAWSKLVFPETGVRQKLVVKFFAGNMSARAPEDEAAKLWAKYGIKDAGFKVLAREHRLTQVLDRADAAVRAELARAGGYFPRELNCKAPEVIPDATIQGPLATASRLAFAGHFHDTDARRAHQLRGGELLAAS